MIRALSRGVRQALQKTLKREFFGYSGEWLLVDSKPVREVIIRDLPVRFRISSSIIRAQLMKHHSSGVCQLAFKEAKTLDFLEQQIRDGDVFYDVGANFGFYVIWAACFAKLEKIVGLEPEALNYAELCQNIHLNQLSNVVALSDGASDVESYEDFHLQKFLPGNHSGRTQRYQSAEKLHSPEHRHKFVQGYVQKMHLIPLDVLIENAGLPEPTVMLMDIDGGELNALKGMSRTLASPSLRALAIETGPGEHRALVHQVLESHRFERVGQIPQARENEYFIRG